METKRLALAFALSAAVLVVWTLLFPAPKPPRPAPIAPRPPATASGLPGSPSGTSGTSGAVTPGPGTGPGARPVVPVEPVAAAAPEETVVSTSLYTARLSNDGAVLTSFTLARFLDAQGKPLDLIRHDAPFPGRTLGLDPADPFATRAAKALYRVEREEVGGETHLTFRYREADGNGLLRTYTFRAGYVVSLRVEREGAGAGPVGVVLGPGLGNPSPEELGNRYTKPGATVVLSPNGSVDRRAKDGLKEVLPLGKGIGAAGLEDNYFLAAFLPPAAAELQLRPVALPLPAAADGKPRAEAESEVVAMQSGALSTDLFFGPKDLAILEKLRPGMDRMIDYGWYAILVKPLLFALKTIQRGVGNWGLSIILITILIKLVLYPLTHKQLVSMKKMSRVQPRVDTIRAKWTGKIKQDPQARLKMNEEMMALYKVEGINPAGGCLPLLLQMPILIAFYNLLAHSIELRHAPFALWITDLSAKDPYYITPILMTASMWLQQQMMPATGDPAMRRVQGFMPLVFGFLFKDVPSGLVLYWLVQNILTIVQQMLLNRFTDLGPASMKPKAP